MLKNILIITFISFGFAAAAQQTAFSSLPANNTLFQNHFRLDSDKIKINFEVLLPNDSRLIISSYGVRSWEDSNALPNVINIAAKAVMRITDSFKIANSNKVVNIHVPIDNAPVSINYKELFAGNTIVLDNGKQQSLKLGMDTISVLKTFSEKTEKDKSVTLRQVQYIFLLKDVDDIMKLMEDKETIEKINYSIDSFMHKSDDRFNRYASYNITYDPFTHEKKYKNFTVNNIPGQSSLFPLHYYAGLGIDLVRSQWAPGAELGYRYFVTPETDKNFYLAVSYSGYTVFKEVSDNKYSALATSFVNIGFGSSFSKSTEFLDNVGMMIGAKVNSVDPSMKGFVLRLSFSFDLSPVIGFRLGFDDNLNYKDQSFTDMGVIINILRI